MPALLILAGGWGSRYGGLKQIDSFGPNGESLLDYAAFDAWQCGFDKIYLLVNKQIADFATTKINKYPYNQLKGNIIVQDCLDIPCKMPNIKRVKPWGTGHALYACRNYIKEPFALINADDFYGRESFLTLSRYLKNIAPTDKRFCLQGFKLNNTLPDEGEVSRGICNIDEEFNLKNINEAKGLKKINGGQITDKKNNTYNKNDLTSMNCWGLTPEIFSPLSNDFEEFLKSGKDLTNQEFMLTEVIKNLTFNKDFSIKLIPSEHKVFGVTHRRDKPLVQKYLAKLHLDKIYPHSLKIAKLENVYQKQKITTRSMRGDILLQSIRDS